MKKFAIIVGLMALALVIGVTGTTLRADKAAAKPTTVIAFSPNICAAFTHLDGTVCLGLNNSANLAAVAAALDGDVDDPDTYKDLVDASAAQLGDDSQWPPVPGAANTQALWVLSFVSNTDQITETADEGVWLASSPKASTFGPGCPIDKYYGTTTPDADCSHGTTGDGVVVDLLYSGVAANAPASALLHRKELGDAQVIVDQDGETETMDYAVVGAPDDLSLAALKTTIQQDSNAPCVIGGYSTKEFTQENALPGVAGLLATVADDDGTPLTGIMVAWLSEDDSDVSLAIDSEHGTTGFLSPTLAKDKVVAAPNLGCGGDVASANKISAAVDDDADGLIEPKAIGDHLDLAVVPAPDTLTLKPDPATIACDGITSSVVSATVLGTDSKPVVSGNAVRFDVVALGTADPINATTDDKGVATSKITPLSGPLAGVTVLATVDETSCTKKIVNSTLDTKCGWIEVAAADPPATVIPTPGAGTPEPTIIPFTTGSVKSNQCWNPCLRETTDATDIQGSVLVNCQQAAPTVAAPPPPPVATPSVRIGGPNTGDGGYLP